MKQIWRALAAAGPALLLLALAWWAQSAALHAGFVSDDDPIILAYAMTHSAADYFFNPAAWRELSAANFTPWLVLEFQVDYRLFGLNATGHAAHMLLELGLCALLLQSLLRRAVPVGWAFLGAALFVLSVPAVAVAHQLMSRHYVAGLMFSLIAMSGDRPHSAPGSSSHPRPSSGLGPSLRLLGTVGAYLLALTCKEVFALLPLLLWRRPGTTRGWAPRPIVLWLVAGGLLPYLLWRRWMLGEWVGGYGAGGLFSPAPALAQVQAQVQVLAQAARHLLETPWRLLGGDGLAVAGLALALVATGILLARRPARAVTLGAALLVILLPLVPVAAGVPDTPRYQFVGMVLLAALLTVPPALALKDRPLAGAAAWLLVAALAVRFGLQSHEWARTQEARGAVVRTMDRPFWTEHSGLLVWLTDDMPYQHVQGIEDIRRTLRPDRPPPQFIYDEIQLPHVALPYRQVWRFEAARGDYADITADLPQRLAAWRDRLRAAPLAGEFDYDAATRFLTWRFGPYAQGRYEVVSVGGSRVEIGRAGRARVNISHPQAYVKYLSPEGWVTYSGLLTIPANGALHWESREGEIGGGASYNALP